MPKIFFIVIILLLFFSVGCNKKSTSKLQNNNHAGHNHTSSTKVDACLDHDHSTSNDKHSENDIDLEAIANATCEHGILQVECMECQNEDEKECQDQNCNHENAPQNHKHSHTSIDFQVLAKKKCEHNILQMECHDCQGELGIVKLDSKIEQKFIKKQKVEKKIQTYTLQLTGSLGVDQLKTNVITPIVSGRVLKINKKLGDVVKKGELLATVQSQEYAKAKFEYITASRRYSYAESNYNWVNTTHANLKKMLESLQKNETKLDLSILIKEAIIGKYKQELIDAASSYRATLSKYNREMQIVKNMRRLYKNIQDISKIPNLDTETKTLAIGEWKGRLLGTISVLEMTQKNYDRERSLTLTNASTQKELQSAESAYRKSLAEYQGLVEEFGLFIEDKEQELQAEYNSSFARYLSKIEEIEMDLVLHRLEIERDYLEASSQKYAAEKMLVLLGLPQQEIEKLSQNNLELAQYLGILEIQAPIAGSIISCNISEGQFVEASKELYTISDLENLWVWCDVYENNLELLKPFQNSLSKLSAKLLLPQAYYEENIPVEIDYLSEQVQETTRTVKIRGIVQNSKRELKPGLFLRLEIQIPAQKSSIFVPESAVFKDDKQTFLFKRWQEYWVRSDVSLGKNNDGRQEILSGIDHGDTIAIDGGFMLKSEILKSKMGAG